MKRPTIKERSGVSIAIFVAVLVLLFLALCARGANLLVDVHNIVSGPVVNRTVTVTLTKPTGAAIAGPWMIAGDSVSLATSTNGTCTFSNLLTIGQYRCDVSGNPSRSFPFSISGTNGTFNVNNLLGTNVFPEMFYDTAQIDALLAGLSGGGGSGQTNWPLSAITNAQNLTDWAQLSTNLFYPSSNPSNFVDASVTNGLGGGVGSDPNALTNNEARPVTLVSNLTVKSSGGSLYGGVKQTEVARFNKAGVNWFDGSPFITVGSNQPANPSDPGSGGAKLHFDTIHQTATVGLHSGYELSFGNGGATLHNGPGDFLTAPDSILENIVFGIIPEDGASVPLVAFGLRSQTTDLAQFGIIDDYPATLSGVHSNGHFYGSFDSPNLFYTTTLVSPTNYGVATNAILYVTNNVLVTSSNDTNNVYGTLAGSVAANGHFTIKSSVAGFVIWTNASGAYVDDPNLSFSDEFAFTNSSGSELYFSGVMLSGWSTSGGVGPAPTVKFGTNYTTNVYTSLELTGPPLSTARFDNTLYVDAGLGNDLFARRGDKQRPWKTLWAAWNAAHDYDVIRVAEGNYWETNSGTWETGTAKSGTHLQVLGAGRHATKFYGNAGASRFNLLSGTWAHFYANNFWFYDGVAAQLESTNSLVLDVEASAPGDVWIGGTVSYNPFVVDCDFSGGSDKLATLGLPAGSSLTGVDVTVHGSGGQDGNGINLTGGSAKMKLFGLHSDAAGAYSEFTGVLLQSNILSSVMTNMPKGTALLWSSNGVLLSVNRNQGGGYTTNLLAPAAGGFTSSKSAMTVTSNSFAHGLGYVPTIVSLVFVCTNADSATGYVAGDEIQAAAIFDAGQLVPASITWANATNVGYGCVDCPNRTLLAVQQKNAQNYIIPTSVANFNLKIYAR